MVLNEDPYWTEVKGWTHDGRMVFGSSRGEGEDNRALELERGQHLPSRSRVLIAHPSCPEGA